MTCLEHYFENLLFHNKDVDGDWNKNALSKEQQEAVKVCYDYILYTLFNGNKEALQKWVREI